jgi:enoyl-[acyl-carrier-protein] reductase (NADH)|nr:hypothetical protein [Kofleriaceae bacterium]
MAKKTETAKKPAAKATPKKTAAAPKAKAAATAAPAAKIVRGPRAAVIAKHKSKAELAKSLADVVASSTDDTDALVARLSKASNQQLLRLQHVAETVKKKFGGRDKLIAAIGTAEKKSKDKDYLAKLEALSLPNLLDLATSAQRRARA